MSHSIKENPGRAQQAGRTAKQEASATASQASGAAREAMGTARHEAAGIAGEASEQARSVAGDLRERAADEVRGQTRHTASELRRWADDLAGMAEHADNSSPARGLVSQAADGGHRAADYLDRRGVSGLAEDVQGFARRQPAAFLGGAVLAGLVIGRITRSSGTGQGQENPSDGTAPPSTATADDREDPASGLPGDVRQPGIADRTGGLA